MWSSAASSLGRAAFDLMTAGLEHLSFDRKKGVRRAGVATAHPSRMGMEPSGVHLLAPRGAAAWRPTWGVAWRAMRANKGGVGVGATTHP